MLMDLKNKSKDFTYPHMVSAENLTSEGNLFGPDIGEFTTSSDDRVEVNMWSVSKGSKIESLHSKFSNILGDEFENIGKKNQQVSK